MTSGSYLRTSPGVQSNDWKCLPVSYARCSQRELLRFFVPVRCDHRRTLSSTTIFLTVCVRALCICIFIARCNQRELLTSDAGMPSRATGSFYFYCLLACPLTRKWFHPPFYLRVPTGAISLLHQAQCLRWDLHTICPRACCNQRELLTFAVQPGPLTGEFYFCFVATQ